jgi:hypothetical protein
MEETSLHLVCILGRTEPIWFAPQFGKGSNWFDIELIWFELGLDFLPFGLALVQ